MINTSDIEMTQNNREKEIVMKIQTLHHCNVCQKACYIIPKTKTHYPYTFRDLDIWAKLVLCFSFILVHTFPDAE